MLSKWQKRRAAIRVSRRAANDYLGIRTRNFLEKLERGDADAQMALAAATSEVAEEEGWDIDVETIKEILQLILEFIKAISEIFGW